MVPYNNIAFFAPESLLLLLFPKSNCAVNQSPLGRVQPPAAACTHRLRKYTNPMLRNDVIPPLFFCARKRWRVLSFWRKSRPPRPIDCIDFYSLYIFFSFTNFLLSPTTSRIRWCKMYTHIYRNNMSHPRVWIFLFHIFIFIYR